MKLTGWPLLEKSKTDLSVKREVIDQFCLQQVVIEASDRLLDTWQAP